SEVSTAVSLPPLLRAGQSPMAPRPSWMQPGLAVRDAPQAALLTMRVQESTVEQDLILRSPPKAGVSKDGPRRHPAPSISHAIALPLRGRPIETVSTNSVSSPRRRGPITPKGHCCAEQRRPTRQTTTVRDYGSRIGARFRSLVRDDVPARPSVRLTSRQE